jgi:hypothetical protein
MENTHMPPKEKRDWLDILFKVIFTAFVPLIVAWGTWVTNTIFFLKERQSIVYKSLEEDHEWRKNRPTFATPQEIKEALETHRLKIEDEMRKEFGAKLDMLLANQQDLKISLTRHEAESKPKIN